MFQSLTVSIIRKIENEWLQEEAEKTRLENVRTLLIRKNMQTPHFLQQDYQTYVSRRAQKRHSLIVSLSDQNRVELQEIKQQKEDLIREFEEKKAGMKRSLFVFIELLY